jgi:hypothetical protein
MVLETLAFSSLNHLTRLVGREDFIKHSAWYYFRNLKTVDRSGMKARIFMTQPSSTRFIVFCKYTSDSIEDDKI